VIKEQDREMVRWWKLKKKREKREIRDKNVKL